MGLGLNNNKGYTATRAEVPAYAAAAARQAQMDNQAEMQANALRSQNLLGAGKLYNASMGENTPIADKLGEWFTPTPDADPLDMGGNTGDIYGDPAADALMGADTAPVQEGLGLADDLSAAVDATEMATAAADGAGLAAAVDGAGLAAGVGSSGAATAAELASVAGMDLGLGSAASGALGSIEAAGALGATGGAAGSAGLMAALGPMAPFAIAALLSGSLF